MASLALALTPLGTAHAIREVTATALPVAPPTLLDGGRRLLPNVEVTALAFGPHGLVYGGGRLLVPQHNADLLIPLLPAGSVALVSHDDGATWMQRVSTTNVQEMTTVPPGGIPWRDHTRWPDDFTATHLSVDPTDPRTAYVAGCTGGEGTCYNARSGVLMLATHDGGQTWAAAIQYQQTGAGLATAQNVATNLILSRDVLARLDRDPASYPRQSEGVAVDAAHSGHVLGCVSGLGFVRSVDAGRTWNVAPVITAPGKIGWLDGFCEFVRDPMAPDAFYALSRWGAVYHSTDDGASWTVRSLVGYRSASHLTDLVVSGTTLYVTAWAGIARSIDGGRTWVHQLGLPSGEQGEVAASVHLGDTWVAGISGWNPVRRRPDAGLDTAPTTATAWATRTNTFGLVTLAGIHGNGIDVQTATSYSLEVLWADPTTGTLLTAASYGGLYRWRP